MKIVLYLFLSTKLLTARAQGDSTNQYTLGIIASADVFYGYDFNQPESGHAQPYFYQYNRHNRFSANLLFVKAALERSHFKANLALQAGTYMIDNYADEPKGIRNFLEANTGAALNARRSLWFEAGLFSSHIGFETVVASDNWTLSRSLLADNSPYFLTGVRLTHSPNEKWQILLMVCNGWQRVKRVPGNTLPAFSSQLLYSPNQLVSFNWSSFVGTDDPDSIRRMRYFNNFYGQFALNSVLALTIGFDIGVQQKEKHSNQYDVWYSPVLIVRTTISKLWSVAVRGEYYRDRNQVIIFTGTPNGFVSSGFSANVNYVVNQKVLCKLEGRWLNSRDKVFETIGNPSNQRLMVTASVSVAFNRSFH